MAISAKWYGTGLLNAFNGGTANWTSGTWKVALCTSSYTPDQDAHDFFNDITNEITGPGYSAGGATLTTQTATYDATSNTVRLKADNTIWASATLTWRYAIVYKSTGTASTSPVWGYVDFGGDESVVSGTAELDWDTTDGILRIVAG
jgi:hypothetical protein